MSQGSFDDKIKNKLEHLQEEYDSSSWDMLRTRLDNELLADQGEDEFIPTIKEKLENHREAYKDEHWMLLNEELDFIDSRRKRLYFLKAAEAVILLLLIYTYWNYNNISGTYNIEVNEGYVNEIVSPRVKPVELIAHLEIGGIMNTSVSVINVPEFRAGASIELLTRQDLHPLEMVDDMKNALPALQAFQKTLTEQSQLDRRPIRPFVVHTENKALPVTPIPAIEEVVLENKPNRKGWWINLPFSYDVNVINSAFDIGYLTANIDQGIFGQSAGLTASYQINSIEFETGIKYSDKKYAPGLIKNYSISSRTKNSILESELDAAYLRQIQIPLMIKLHAYSSTKSHLYAVTGIGLNAIIDSDYSIKKTIQPFARIDAQDVTAGLLELEDLPDGLAEGGRFNENFYATAILGFGIQTEFKQGVAVYFQPQFQYNLTNQLNEFIEKVHSFNMEAGVKFKF